MRAILHRVSARAVAWGTAGLLVLSMALCAYGPPARAASQTHAAPAGTGAANWPMFMHDIGHSAYNSAGSLPTPLSLLWMHGAAGSGMALNEAVVNGVVYWGAVDGHVRAMTSSGSLLWTSPFLGQTTFCSATSPIGISSTPAVATVSINGVATSVVFVGGGGSPAAIFYALNASTGAIIWHTTLRSATGAYIWASPVVYTPKGSPHPSVYVGFSSQGDCPLVQGAVFQMDATSGGIQHVFNTVPNGCVGASVWGSTTIDGAAGAVYFATGNGGPTTKCSVPEPYGVAVVELSASTLSYIGSWQVPAAQQTTDSDFGSTPTLFTATIGGVVTPMVGAVNKNGVYYAFRRGALGSGPVWTARIANGGGSLNGSLSSSAWDGARLYAGGGATTINGVTCKGSLRALNPATGLFIWQACFTGSAVVGAVAAIPGLVVIGEGRTIAAVNSSTGKVVSSYVESNAGLFGEPTIGAGVLYMADSAGNIYALK
jgi:polyvinyl alcohol dehydrogenase (cytochrome)